MTKKFSIINCMHSFKYAFKGLKLLFKTQHNAWIHLSAFVLIVVSGFYFKLNKMEWIAILFAAGFVFTAEIINTSIEFLTDHVSPAKHEQAGKVKDLAAAAVLIAAITALLIGALVFIPKIF
ncbi:MAG: diacylglycerol kinase family protein [Bacteroidetes bacterium]|nr:diacylglycerol kinase family protein [Bacteroidota bacterium]